MLFKPQVRKRTSLVALALAVVVFALAAASTSEASLGGSVANYYGAVSCSGYSNYGSSIVSVNSPVIFASRGYSQQRVRWDVFLLKQTPSGLQAVNSAGVSGVINGQGQFNLITWRTDANGYGLHGSFVVLSFVTWLDASGNAVDMDQFLFGGYSEFYDGSRWTGTSCTFR